ncbi:MAG: hypothetical protein M3N95_14095 [Actinomycetota bacterium]|nr:hypothetical protein [Actinomycetota bacterium]
MNLQRATGITLVAISALASLAACSSAAKSPPSSIGSSTGSPGANPGAHATESAPAGDIPDTQAFVPYTSTTPGYTVNVPEGWARTTTGKVIAFTDKYNSIQIAAATMATQPTVSSARSSELPVIAAASSAFRLGDVQSVTRSAGSAVLITYQADSAPNPVTGKVVVEAVQRYEFWRSGSEVTITLASPVGSDNVDPWRKVTDSFAWTR